ncbi:MAG TPA: carboxypeptidase-like regulatory domain-containing protein [Bryobacteraceae bacterium]|jgi:carboxypeptidase family protein|nr:carboxypeptidase-like regulatory domain-containing protein [Bryobacteraceae bacterium]
MKNRLLLILAVSVIAAALAHSAPVVSPTSAGASLQGVVTDPSGAVIPAATVTVSGSNFVRTLFTDESGQYSLSGLLPGNYSVQVHSAGFAPFGKSGLVLTAGYKTEANAQLEIRAARQTVTVTAR